MPLRNLQCDFVTERDVKILGSIKSLHTINGKAADQFCKEVTDSFIEDNKIGEPRSLEK